MFNPELSKYVKFSISRDEMSATMNLSDKLTPELIKPADVLELAQNAGIVRGINKAKILEIIASENYGEPLVIARGLEPENGTEGYYDFRFNTSPNKKPTINPDGSVDYYDLHLFDCVNEGDVVAVYHPKVEGKPGYTVRGRVKPPKRLVDLPKLRGSGFELKSDGVTYIASTDGKPELKFGQLNIRNVYQIRGDVSLSVGNINFRGDLLISGSVLSGMRVIATGDITIGGTVEDAEVISGKSILIKGGIMGGGKGLVQAKNDVFAAFIENSNVKAGRNINSNSIINSSVTAEKDVVVTGKSGTIIGGVVQATANIKAKNIGSPVGVKTEVSAGVAAQRHMEYKSFQQSLTSAEFELAKIEKAIELLESRGGANTQLMVQLIKTKIDKSSYIYKYRSICATIESELEDGHDSSISAIVRLHPGVIVRIDGYATVSVEEYRTIRFKRNGNKIVSLKYTIEDDKD